MTDAERNVRATQTGVSRSVWVNGPVLTERWQKSRIASIDAWVLAAQVEGNPDWRPIHGGDMFIEPALLSPISALLGALIGGGASLIAAVYTQRTQNRLQRVAGEVAKREAVYADFVMSASNLLLNAYVHDDIALGGDEQHLIGLINRMRLFAPPEVVNGAEAVLRSILKISLEPSIELRRLAKDALSRSMEPDPLQSFSQICRADLDNVFRTAR